MSNACRLKAQNDRIRKNIAAESIRLGDGREYVTEDRIWSIWMRQLGDADSKTELDEFQECVPSPDLARNLYTAIKTMSILICIHWNQWHEFAERFCQLTDTVTLDDVHDLDERLPFSKDALSNLLFPDDSYYANNFLQQQFVFLPLTLEENQSLQTHPSEYRLPLLDDQGAVSTAQGERILAVKIAVGHFRFGKEATPNPTAIHKPHHLSRKRINDIPDLDRELQNLAMLRGADDTNDRIMRHLVALKLGSEYNIFYIEAELDLEDLLSGEYHSCYTDNDMAPQPLLNQAWHLAGALDFLHTKMTARHIKIPCCHLDLSPANILVTKNAKCPTGKWMLTDFGVAVVRSDAESAYSVEDGYSDERHIRGTTTRSMRYPGPYQPPEMERSGTKSRGEHVQKGNIWSFGCILTVLLVFSVGGGPLVKKLDAIKRDDSQTDYFYLSANSGVNQVHKAKPQIKNWASQLATHQGTWASDWLRLIIDSMLQVSPTQRLDGKQIQDQLELIRKQAPTDNVWKNTPANVDARPLAQSLPAESTDRRPSWVSILSSRRPSTAQVPAQASTPELAPTIPSGRDLDADPLMIVHNTPQFKHSQLSPINSESSESTISPSSAQGLPIDELNLQNELPNADDLAVVSDADRLVIWHGEKVMPYSNVSGVFRPTDPLTPGDGSEAMNAGPESKKSARWIHVSLSGPYMALVKSGPSSTQITVMDLDHWQDVQPNTEWPSSQGLRSTCVSCRGSVAFFYDKVVKFRCTRENAYLRNSTWSTSSENICSATFSRDGNKFFAVSWTQLWIGTVEQNRWVLRASGDHHLSARVYLSFRPYLIPFSSREALFAHNPAEDKLCYLESRTSTKVDLGAGVLRVAISESEDTILYIRQLRRGTRPRFLSQSSFYGLSWRTMSRSQTGQVMLGPESETVDLHLPVEKGKRFTLTSCVEQQHQPQQGQHGSGAALIAWVATAKGEVRKCRLS